jgi:NADPH-dependent 2,4-dienoyl-CoA reductase/sulfur reductase-like enzyme
MDHVVVIGASLAGLRAAEAVRSAGFDGDLTLVGSESHLPYTRPPLSKQLLAGTMTQADTALRHQLECEWRLGVAATALDADAREVALSNGDVIGYDGLVIATGSSARRWHSELPALRGIMSLRNVDQALALQALVKERPSVVIVGAGFIGCEVAATLRGLEVPVTLIDIASQPMVPLGPEIGALMAELHREHGVDLRLGIGVESFEGSGGQLERLNLADGSSVPARIALIATGAEPNTGWLRGSGLLLDPKVICDHECFAVGVERIVCAGDITRWPHPLAGGELVSVEHWSNAVDMGRAAGRNLVVVPEERKPYADVPTFWSDQYGLKLQSAGFTEKADRFEVVEGSFNERRFVAVAEQDRRLTAVVAMNMVRRLIHFQRFVAERASLAEALSA